MINPKRWLQDLEQSTAAIKMVRRVVVSAFSLLFTIVFLLAVVRIISNTSLSIDVIISYFTTNLADATILQLIIAILIALFIGYPNNHNE